MERVTSGPDFLERAGTYTLDDVLRVQEEAARLQAKVNAQAMSALVGGLVRAVRWAVKGTTRFLREQWVSVAAYRVHGELNRLSDRQLARLGIGRDGIAAFVAATVAAEPAERPVALRAIAGGRLAGEAMPQEQPVRRRAA